jgi:predicted Zn-dependent protease
VAAAIGGQAALMQEQINFTRSNEQEADRVGMQILADSSFDPRAMPAFFERMGRATRSYATVLPEFLRTHPVTTSRIADAQGRAEKYPYRQVADDHRRYFLARAALRVQQARTPDEAIQGFRSALNDHRHRDEPAERYGLALALMRGRQLEAARREIDRLRSEEPGRVEYIVTSARLHVRANQVDRAVAELEQASSRMPGSYPVRFELGETLLSAGKAERAAKVLEPLAKSHADTPQVMRVMAQAAGQAGRRAEGHQYMAEYYYLTGAVDSAVLQLEIGLKQPGVSFYQSSVMEARLAELKNEAEELKKEKKRL